MKRKVQHVCLGPNKKGKWWNLVREAMIGAMWVMIKDGSAFDLLKNGDTKFKGMWQCYLEAGGKEEALHEIFGGYLKVGKDGESKLTRLSMKEKGSGKSRSEGPGQKEKSRIAKTGG